MQFLKSRNIHPSYTLTYAHSRYTVDKKSKAKTNLIFNIKDKNISFYKSSNIYKKIVNFKVRQSIILKPVLKNSY